MTSGRLPEEGLQEADADGELTKHWLSPDGPYILRLVGGTDATKRNGSLPKRFIAEMDTFFLLAILLGTTAHHFVLVAHLSGRIRN